MTVILSQQFFSGEGVPPGLLGAVLARALALHSRQGREPLRGNFPIKNRTRKKVVLGVLPPKFDPVRSGRIGPALSPRGPRACSAPSAAPPRAACSECATSVWWLLAWRLLRLGFYDTPVKRARWRPRKKKNSPEGVCVLISASCAVWQKG